MKKPKLLSLALLVASLLAIPAAAQKGRMGHSNNNGFGQPHGQARAEEVQNANKKDKDRKASKGNNGEKTRTRKGWDKNAEHNAKANGHRK